MAKVNLITQSEYAKLRGVSEAAVSKAISGGRISLIDGKIDPVVADMQWKANSRARASAQQPGQLALDDATASIRVDSTEPDGPKVDGYMLSRNRREAAEAERAELSLAEDKGELIRVDAVKGVLGSMFSATRDALLQLPARMAPLLAAESDPAAVQTLLHAEIHQALQVLAGASKQIGPSMVVLE